jgi:predicted O-linked N-acetylglucosamine transferase (SPINDLY family)
VRLRPADAVTHSDLLFTLHYHPGYTTEQLYTEHVAWAERHAAPLYPEDPSYPNERDPGRRLRVGYVSADFRRHTRAMFMEPVLAAHDREAFEVYCYSDVARPDETTARLRGYGHAWRDTAGLSDGQLADLVRQDRIDVLVELTGHMGGNRLLAFARKPAPVQVAYPGYPNTTGLKTVDYLICDEDRDPPGAERYFTEELVRLAVTSQCYRPPDDAPPVGPLPARSAGHVTFGCLNKLVKVTPAMMRAWAQVLRAVPGSREEKGTFRTPFT